ncbi:MAG TPA: aminotransferase class IV [Amycolatopsis sp.]|nr:aminotransferase class IV [Amycolatopsis sp.]
MTKLGESLRTFWDGPDEGRRIPFGSSSVQHGTAVFEGIRCYATPTGPALFRLDDHLRRLLGSARLLGIGHDYDLDRLSSAVLGAAAATALPGCYVRPGLFCLDPVIDLDLRAWPYRLGIEVWALPPEPAPHSAVRLTISPWRRPSPLSFPPRAKAVGTYVTSALAKTAAVAAGFDEAVQLDPDSGRVAEATTTNIFVIRDGALVTPWLEDSLLAGITRDSVLVLARELGIDTREGPVEVADLTSADEVFLTGTAGELVAASCLDEHGYPEERPVFDAISAAFRAAVTGAGHPHEGWLTTVPSGMAAVSRG